MGAGSFFFADSLFRGKVCRIMGEEENYMTAIMMELYDALREAGASEDKSRSAAKAIADYDSRFNRVEADLMVLKWMVGAILAGVVSLVMKAFF